MEQSNSCTPECLNHHVFMEVLFQPVEIAGSDERTKVWKCPVIDCEQKVFDTVKKVEEGWHFSRSYNDVLEFIPQPPDDSFGDNTLRYKIDNSE